jgi:hypothetical protein
MRIRVRMLAWRGHSCPRNLTRKEMFMPRMLMPRMLLPIVLVGVLFLSPLPVLLARQVLLPLDPNIHLRS